MFFYELYEADDDVSLGITLAHDERISPHDFLAAVEEARGQIIESYEEESLIEAIALELERSHGFYPALDHCLQAAVRASTEEGETALIATANALESASEEEEDPDLRDAEDLLAGRQPRALRSAVVELELPGDEEN
jgi:hypothetical protein